MTPKISFITAVACAALVFAVPAFGDSWGADQNQAAVRVSPDLVDRVAAASQQELSSMLDARERSFAAKRDTAVVVAPDPVRDDRFRIDRSSILNPATTTHTAGDVEWLQVGIGGAILLAIGLVVTLRVTGVRQPAH